MAPQRRGGRNGRSASAPFKVHPSVALPQHRPSVPQHRLHPSVRFWDRSRIRTRRERGEEASRSDLPSTPRDRGLGQPGSAQRSFASDLLIRQQRRRYAQIHGGYGYIREYNVEHYFQREPTPKLPAKPEVVRPLLRLRRPLHQIEPPPPPSAPGGTSRHKMCLGAAK